MEKHFEKAVVETKSGGNEKVEDDVETIEKIAEMISTSHKDVDDNNPKTKKRLQILMCRNINLDTCNDSRASSSHNEKNIRSSETNANDSDQANKKIKTIETKTSNSEMSEDNLLEKSRFEEIEGKLEEMFAGVEDEQLVNTPPPRDEKLSKKINNNVASADNNKDPLNKSPLPTKAAQKATTSLSTADNSKQLDLLVKDYKNLSIPKSLLYLKSIPPRRRLSIGLNRELLNFSAKVNNEIDSKKSSNSKVKGEENITRVSHNLKSLEDVEQDGKNAAKLKIGNKNQKKCSKYKKEIFDIKCSSSCKKKVVRKSETSSKEKPKKMARMHRLLSSENDTEEKQMQTKDNETKNRAPFILVKNNGNIVVVNTVTTDDSNEKCPRSKKSNNYVFERKTVKGCYSSTLGNRYDADTTDSSWKCVFCQIGPHRKGLGDLFGPYVISSDCDEYRSTKDYLENAIYTKKSPPFLNETMSNSQSKCSSNIKFNGEHLINIYTSGMSQVSADCYEIWVHEECAVWAPNIFVVGSRLAGLEEATWISTRYECEYCLKQGALLCCLQRDCKAASHVPCARESKWLLDESKFWVYCSKHALNKFLNKN